MNKAGALSHHWRQWVSPPEDTTLGHGICFYDRTRLTGNQLIAFVEGFAWFHGQSGVVVTYLIMPDSQTPRPVLQELRQMLREQLKTGSCPSGRITSRIDAVANA